jgi:hypothetical protein
MTDLQWLYSVLVLLYLLECAVWLRRGTVVWIRGWGRRWRQFRPSAVLGNSQGGLVMASPLPPAFGAVLMASFPSLAFGESGILAGVPTPLEPGVPALDHARFFSWSEVRAVAVRGRRVVVDGFTLVRCTSESAAVELRRELHRLAQGDEAERGRRLTEWTSRAFDREALEKRWREFREAARPLALWCGGYFTVLFVGIPVILMLWGLGSAWPGLVVAIGGSATGTAWMYRRAHARLYPDGEEDRFTQTLMILLSPPLAVRALEWLGRPLFESWHPLVVAIVFGREAENLRLARRVLRDLRWPPPSVALARSAQAACVEQTWRDLQERGVRRLLRDGRVDPDELLQPPAPADGDCRSYCPRCEAQFTTPGGDCRDCGGVTLLPLPRRPASTECSHA